ncbi:MAG: hypothetical protein RJA70_3634 [Pseudomonadota bacterium]|jgi:hypothetical protein
MMSVRAFAMMSVRAFAMMSVRAAESPRISERAQRGLRR